MAERASVFPQVAAEVFRLAKQNRLSRYHDVISAVLSRFGDPRRPSAICVALPRYALPSCNSSRATARHRLVQCKLSRPISPFHDLRPSPVLCNRPNITSNTPHLVVYGKRNATRNMRVDYHHAIVILVIIINARVCTSM